MAYDWNEFRKRAVEAGVPAVAIDGFISTKRTQEALKSGNLSLSDIPIEKRASLVAGLPEGTKLGSPEATAEEKKRLLKYSDLSSSLDILEKNLSETEHRGAVGGNVGLLAQWLTGGKAMPETADYEALRKGLIGPVARAISGEVGVLTDKDIGRAENLLPKVTDDPGLAQKKLSNLRSIIQKRTTEPGLPSGKVDNDPLGLF